MAPRSASVHIANPCAESWASMTPTATGRRCAACQKTVVDFSLKTDSEILEALKQAAGGTCGRFRAEQLARPLRPLAAQVPSRWRAWLAAAVAVWGLREGIGAPARAQAAVEQGPGATERRAAAAPPVVVRGVVVEGIITDSISHERLPGAIILLRGTTVGTYTKADGTFQLPVPDLLSENGPIVLSISYVGYETQQVALPPVTSASAINVALKLSPTFMGEVVIIDYHAAPKLTGPWHPRRFYNWSKYWLTQPFRRG